MREAKIIAAAANPISLGYMSDICCHKAALEDAGRMWPSSWVTAAASLKRCSGQKSSSQPTTGQAGSCQDLAPRAHAEIAKREGLEPIPRWAALPALPQQPRSWAWNWTACTEQGRCHSEAEVTSRWTLFFSFFIFFPPLLLIHHINV